MGPNHVHCVTPEHSQGFVTVEVSQNGVDFSSNGLLFEFTAVRLQEMAPQHGAALSLAGATLALACAALSLAGAAHSLDCATLSLTGAASHWLVLPSQAPSTEAAGLGLLEEALTQTESSACLVLHCQ